MANAINRRTFIKGAGAAAAATLTGAPYFVPSRAFGANERLTMGIIGAGGRGRSVMTEFQQQGVDFKAVADVFEPNRNAGIKVAGKGAVDAKISGYRDYRELLEKEKGLDAILIATPEHQHAMQLIDTVEAGYHSYCEKPMSHSISEGNMMVRKVRESGKIVQIGMQRRSTPMIRRGKEIIDTAVLGNVHYVRVKWNWNIAKPLDNSPLPADSLDWREFCKPVGKVAFEPMKFRSWRYFWKFSGGNITDQGTHLMDVVQWYMGEEFKPVTPNYAECFGKVYKMTGSETPDVFSSILQYDNFIASWTLDYATTYQNSWSIEFHGDKGTMAVDDYGVTVYDEKWEPEDGSSLRSKKPPIIREAGGLSSVDHVRNLIDCIRNPEVKLNAPVEIGHLAVCGPHLANVAFHAKERAYLNDEVTKTTNWRWKAERFWNAEGPAPATAAK